MSKVKLYIFVTLAFAGIIGTVWAFHSDSNPADAPVDPHDVKDPIIVSYTCDDTKTLVATYIQDNVSLVLSDTRGFVLHKTSSASGIRYANDNESIVFWGKGNTAFLQEHDTITYKDCVEQPKPEPDTLSPNPIIDTRPGTTTSTEGCYVGGCSGQICSEERDVASNCEWKDRYACYRTAVCERQSTGECGWTQTPELQSCLENANASTSVF